MGRRRFLAFSAVVGCWICPLILVRLVFECVTLYDVAFLMNVAQLLYYRTLYKHRGLFWNGELYEFIKLDGGGQIDYLRPPGLSMCADFRFPATIGRYKVPFRSCASYQLSVQYFGEDVAPVGVCCQGDTELFLTEKGRFFGCGERMLFGWGSRDFYWRESVKLLLNGLLESTIAENL